jgi:hypothetical protein
MPESGFVEAFKRKIAYLFDTLRRLGAVPGEVEDLAQEIPDGALDAEDGPAGPDGSLQSGARHCFSGGNASIRSRPRGAGARARPEETGAAPRGLRTMGTRSIGIQ